MFQDEQLFPHLTVAQNVSFALEMRNLPTAEVRRRTGEALEMVRAPYREVLAAAMAGLSMALGAFIAGLLLAETEYRHEVEVTIAPFKGLLLGLFFVSVGMLVDPAAILADWPADRKSVV